MKITNLNIRKKALALALAGTIALTPLTSCKGKSSKETEKVITDAYTTILVINDTATIIDTKNYKEIYNDVFEIYSTDGSAIEASSKNIVIVHGKTYEEVEALAYEIVGKDGRVIYYESNAKTKSK